MNSAADLGDSFYCSRCNCSCFCTDHKYEKDRTLRDKLDSDQFKGGNESSQLRHFVYFQSCFENVHTRRSRDTVYANSGMDENLN